ncbi:hypothetical protein HDU80_004107 [Chytriomyces hyalinus]|nr:hypothetical protein HDU80_004107 [Chytriomyces hyalinus]
MYVCFKACLGARDRSAVPAFDYDYESVTDSNDGHADARRGATATDGVSWTWWTRLFRRDGHSERRAHVCESVGESEGSELGHGIEVVGAFGTNEPSNLPHSLNVSHDESPPLLVFDEPLSPASVTPTAHVPNIFPSVKLPLGRAAAAAFSSSDASILDGPVADAAASARLRKQKLVDDMRASDFANYTNENDSWQQQDFTPDSSRQWQAETPLPPMEIPDSVSHDLFSTPFSSALDLSVSAPSPSDALDPWGGPSEAIQSVTANTSSTRVDLNSDPLLGLSYEDDEA